MADEAEGLARYVPVTLGIHDGSRVQILEPNLEGRVITLGQHLLEDGSPILLTTSRGPASDTTRAPGAGDVP
jgi:hypothetical protein